MGGVKAMRRRGRREAATSKDDPARAARLAAALRDNLARRKRQARAQAADGERIEPARGETDEGRRD